MATRPKSASRWFLSVGDDILIIREEKCQLYLWWETGEFPFLERLSVRMSCFLDRFVITIVHGDGMVRVATERRPLKTGRIRLGMTK